MFSRWNLFPLEIKSNWVKVSNLQSCWENINVTSSQETLELSTTRHQIHGVPEWEQSRYDQLHLHRYRAPSQLVASWSEAAQGPEIGSSGCNTLCCRSRTAPKMHNLQQPIHFSPSGLTWRPWLLKANGKSSISSDLQFECNIGSFTFVA